MPKILFFSALDFKEKSIEVIKRTPLKYAEQGWSVDYIVLRDNSKLDNYIYESEINPTNIQVYRLYLPLIKILNYFKDIKIIRRPLQKLAYLLGVLKMVVYFIKLNKRTKKKYDIIYGYEVQGIITIKILKSLGYFKHSKTVNRFQGSFLYSYWKNKNFTKLISHLEDIIAFKIKANLYIITDDGTSGDKIFHLLNSDKTEKLKFWPNGSVKHNIKNQNSNKNQFIFLTVSRLNKWKRVDRAIQLISELDRSYNFKLIIVGDGPEKESLVNLTKKLCIEHLVTFTGAIKSDEVIEYYQKADFFLSFYDGSNVGNPLFESIRSNKIIFTLNNGDTGKWIKHKNNGFIYNEDKLFNDIYSDIYLCMKSSKLRDEIKRNLIEFEQKNLWTWEERLNEEFTAVNNLLIL